MAANGDLFDLIKTLTKSEKRYFRMSASLYSRNKVNKYVHLFDLIDRCEVYDEEAIRVEFAARFGERHFAEAKYYLYNAILKALHAFTGEHQVEIRLATMIHQARILCRKKLFRQASKILRKVRDEAVVYELWPTAVEALQMESHLLLFKGAQNQERLERVFEEIEQHSASWVELLRNCESYSRMLALRRMVGHPRNAEQLQAYQKVMDEADERRDDSASTLSARFYYKSAQALYHEAQNDQRAALDLNRSLIPLVESSASLSRNSNVAMVPILYCICVSSADLGDLESFLHYYPLLLQHTTMQPDHIHYRLRIQARALGAQAFAEMGDFDRAVLEAAELEHCLEAFGKAPESGISGCVYFALHDVHFGLGNLNQCIDYLNRILDLKDRGLPTMMYMQARVYQLIVHFELGNLDLLESLFRSTHRFMIANGCDYGTERAVLSFIRKALRTGTTADRRQLFIEFLNELNTLQDNPMESNFNTWWLLICWLESRVVNRPYVQVVQEKSQRRFTPVKTANGCSNERTSGQPASIDCPSQPEADVEMSHRTISL